MNLGMTLVGPLIGMAGVVIGIVLNEYLRRGRRIEQYSSEVFGKRLIAYEGLMNLINDGTEIAQQVIENPDFTAQERHTLVSGIIGPIARHVDRNALYLDEELGAHCVALFMGVEDIHDASNDDKPQLLKDYNEMRREAGRMIKEDSGVAQIDKMFRSINRPAISSPVIERIRELRADGRATK